MEWNLEHLTVNVLLSTLFQKVVYKRLWNGIKYETLDSQCFDLHFVPRTSLLLQKRRIFKQNIFCCKNQFQNESSTASRPQDVVVLNLVSPGSPPNLITSSKVGNNFELLKIILGTVL